MPKRIIIPLIGFILSILFLIPSKQSVKAADVTPNPTIAGMACDLCGWCPPNPTSNPNKPGNWESCNRCLYTTPTPAGSPYPKQGMYYTVLGCLSTDPTGGPFVQSILSIIMGIAGGVAFISMLIGIFIVMTSSGNPVRIQTGKDLITSSIFGLLLIIFSVFLLRVVGFDILRIPGIT